MKIYIVLATLICSMGWTNVWAQPQRVVAQANATPSSAPQASPDIVLVPKGTLVVVATTESTNSYSARTGSKIRYEVVQDAIVSGHVIAKAGDTAQGAVQEGEAGDTGVFGIGTKYANLRVSVDEVFSFCGDTIHVDFDRSEYRRRQGAFGSNKDVHIVKGQKYVALTDRVQKICGEVTTATPQPIPSDALSTSTN
jgi:uncharacterized SAM-binding protein YcdF (DUF218 family)